jgi:IS605 OrfB family transposase
LRWKLANVVTRVARERHYAIVLEELGDEPAKDTINHINDDRLRHRVYQASFKGVQKAVEEKAKEHGVPVVYVDPRNITRTCPVHSAEIAYINGSRVGRCPRGWGSWHRDFVARYNLLLRARLGDGSLLQACGSTLDGDPVSLGSTAAHEPTGIPKSLWAR